MTGDNRNVVVGVSGVTVELDGHCVLHDINFNVHEGGFVGIIGPNGAGKTTLMRTIMGLMPVVSGRVEVFGSPPGGKGSDAIGYVPQRQSISPEFPATVGDVVMMGRLRQLGAFGFPGKEDWERVDRSLELVGMQDRRDRPVGRMSGGEQRRVMLAQALCASTRLLVLDEPTVGLDLPAEHEFYGLLRRLIRDLTLTIVAVSHDLVAMAGQSDELICINQRMHIHGNAEEVIHSHAIREAYRCEFDFLGGELAHHETPGHQHNG
ncbi:MAG: ABC transporter ATP-binding protein [Deltaproteobacteria bacterium]|nr:ABC transporter ATP-binding protein [Deltaproteobacteria bacterium]